MPQHPFRWSWPPLALALLFTTLSTAITWAEHASFNSTSLDMAVYTQLVWNTAQGHPFQTSLLLENRLHLAEHLALFLLPLAPLFGVASDVRLLLLLQQLALAAAGLPVYWYACRRLGTGPGLLILACYYAMPTLTEVAFDAVYPIAFVALPIGAAAAFALAGRLRLAALLALTPLVWEEEAALATVGVGLFLALFRPCGRQTGLAVVGAGGLWLVLSELFVMPGYSQTLARAAEVRAQAHFGELRADPLGWLRLVATTRLEPDAVRLVAPRAELPPCQQPGQCSALRWWIYPTGGLALLSPSTLVMSAPTAGALLLADKPGRFRRHWAAPMLPIIWLATVVGFSKLERWHPALRGVGAALLVLSSVITYRLDGSLPLGSQFEPNDIQLSAAGADLRRLGSTIPAEASVGASRRGLAHLAGRRELYVFPPKDYAPTVWPPDEPPAYYLIDLSNADSARELNGAASPLRTRPPYEVVERTPNALLLRRG